MTYESAVQNKADTGRTVTDLVIAPKQWFFSVDEEPDQDPDPPTPVRNKPPPLLDFGKSAIVKLCDYALEIGRRDRMTRYAEIEKTRVQLDLLPNRVEAMNTLMDKCDIATRKELFDNAMTLFEIAVEAVWSGKELALYNQEQDKVERIIFPALKAAARNAARDNTGDRNAELARPRRLGAVARTVADDKADHVTPSDVETRRQNIAVA